MRSLSFIFALFCCTFSVHGQYFANENKVWIFGIHARVDFTSGAPVAGGISPANVFEGGTCVSNSAGELLFYTDGDTVFNRLGVPMPNGSNITPYVTWSTTQSAVIVPFINDTSRYYIFSMEQQAATPPDYCHLSYSIVDMTLDGGLGNVLVGATGIVLDDKMGEKLIAVPGNNCNMWVIAHKKDTTLFYVYEITATGIGAPAVYNVGIMPVAMGMFGPFCNGVMKCSHDRRHLFMATLGFTTVANGNGQLFDFDPGTGVVSNCRPIVPNEGLYGAEFSPDNSKVYVVSTDSSSIYQYDISLPSLASIQASRTKVSVGMAAGDIKLAADGKLYFAGSAYSGHSLGCIPFPNNAGTSCGFNPGAVDLTPYMPQMGLPNLYWRSPMPVLWGDVNLCVGSTSTYTSTIPGGTWSSSSPASLDIDASTGAAIAHSSGIDTIVYAAPGGCGVSLIVTVNVSPASLGDMPSLCVGDFRTLTNAVSGGTWSSSAPGVATIDSTLGTCVGVMEGTCIITYAIGACYSTSMLYVLNCPSGTPNVNAGQEIFIYPVPVDNILNVKCAGAQQLSICLYDMAGRLVVKRDLAQGATSIILPSLPAGSFQCTIYDAGGNIQARKLITKM